MSFLICLVCVFQSFNVTKRQHVTGGLVHTSSTLSIPAVQRSHSGNFTCIIHSESGDGAATGRLKVLGKLTGKRRLIWKRK